MKLGNYISIITGYPFKSNEFSFKNSEYPVIKIKELKKNGILLTKDTCFVKQSNDLSQYLLKKDDIIIALTGNPPTKGGIEAIVGRCCKYDLNIPAYMNQRICKVFSSSDLLLNKYLYYFLSLDKTIINLAQRCSGSANQANISSNDIKDLDIYLPNIKLQQHIVNIKRRHLCNMNYLNFVM